MGLILFVVIVLFLWAYSYFSGEFKLAIWKEQREKLCNRNPPLTGWNLFWALVGAGFQSFSPNGKRHFILVLFAMGVLSCGYSVFRYNQWQKEQQVIAWKKEAEEQRQAKKLAHEHQQRSVTLEVARSAANEFSSSEDVEPWIGKQELVVDTSGIKWKAGDVTLPEVVEFLQAEKARLHVAEIEATVEEYLVSTINDRSTQSALQYLMKVRKEIANVSLIDRVDRKVEKLTADAAQQEKEKEAEQAKRKADAERERKKREKAKASVESKFNGYCKNRYIYEIESILARKKFRVTDQGMTENAHGYNPYVEWSGTYEKSGYTFNVKVRLEYGRGDWHFWIVTVS